jgi:ABC-type nickel/cobalt efflux system permease component RcnA
VTFSHTFGVLVLGVVVLAASNTIVPERLYPWLTLASGLIVVVIGAGLVARALFGTRRSTAYGHLHDDDHVHKHGTNTTTPTTNTARTDTATTSRSPGATSSRLVSPGVSSRVRPRWSCFSARWRSDVWVLACC